MTQPANAMEIFQLLDKSNCRQCGEKTCLAFAGAVFTGRRELPECPALSPEVLNRFRSASTQMSPPEQSGEEYLAQLKKAVVGLDLAAAAERTGGSYAAGQLTLKILGKDLSVDADGNLYADIHVNPWVAVPFLNHILDGTGTVPIGEWVSFRELKDGKERYPLFQKRCEDVLKQVADTYIDLFDDMVHIFGGRQVDKQFESDVSVVLHPLPRIPMMVCYWRPEDGMASSLNLFFDRTADRNLDIGSIFSIGTGIAAMFTKLTLRHGFARDICSERNTG